MAEQTRSRAILTELQHHAPFTLFGALTGIICMFLFKGAGDHTNYRLFQVFHPGHVFLSALVTVSLYKLRSGKTNLLLLIVIGYLGSIGVATLSDCIVPYFGETILGVVVPGHSQLHAGHGHDEEAVHSEDEEHVHTEGDEHEHSETQAGHDCSEHGGLHLGFIEDWYLVNPAALLGVLLAFWIPHEKLHTKIPHAGHVLISTWASSFHVLMNTQIEMGLVFFIGMFVVLFIAVWLPCCISDIIFPILLVGPGRVPHCCPLHTPKRSEEPETHA
ncbi:hypothetical protein ACFL6U_01715 [Planctomycetota bacterium]